MSKTTTDDEQAVDLEGRRSRRRSNRHTLLDRFALPLAPLAQV
jgi:hypothetical protein